MLKTAQLLTRREREHQPASETTTPSTHTHLSDVGTGSDDNFCNFRTTKTLRETDQPKFGYLHMPYSISSFQSLHLYPFLLPLLSQTPFLCFSIVIVPPCEI
uniref:Uncharacterized protein n=1 Tax=Lates calcarifer TaxID=8187 RepID=A0A4W6F128_LATCA